MVCYIMDNGFGIVLFVVDIVVFVVVGQILDGVIVRVEYLVEGNRVVVIVWSKYDDLYYFGI